jgi:4-hydroxy-3-methylbut-2-enyl diphosphate reductase
LEPAWFAGKSRVGLTAGASAPEVLVEEIIAQLHRWGVSSVQPLTGVVENTAFPLPRELTN